MIVAVMAQLNKQKQIKNGLKLNSGLHFTILLMISSKFVFMFLVATWTVSVADKMPAVRIARIQPEQQCTFDWFRYFLCRSFSIKTFSLCELLRQYSLWSTKYDWILQHADTIRLNRVTGGFLRFSLSLTNCVKSCFKLVI